jgi:hypothetical protein
MLPAAGKTPQEESQIALPQILPGRYKPSRRWHLRLVGRARQGNGVMNRSKWMSFGTFVALLLATVSELRSEDASADRKYRLRYQFQPGQSVYYTVHNETHRSFQYKDSRQQMREGSDSLKHYRVASLTNEGGAVLELTIDRTAMYVRKDGQQVSYDSTRDQTPPEGFAAVGASIGKPWLNVSVSARGEMLLAKPTEGSQATVDEKESLSSADFLSRVLPLLPAEEEVAIGSEWKEPFTIEVPEGDTLKKQARLQRRYKLVGVEGDVATITMKTEILMPDRTPQQEARIAQIRYSGTFTVDHVRGVLLSRDLKIDQHVATFDGPASEMRLKVAQKDELAPAGAATPAPEIPEPPVQAVSAEVSIRGK